MQEYEAKLSGLDAEIKEIKEVAKQHAAAEHDRILAAAEIEAEAIRAAGVRAGEREAAIRRTELENEIVDQALARAEAAIRSTFGTADQRRLVDAWVSEVSEQQVGQAGGVN